MVDRERGLGQGMQMLRLRVENNLQLLCRHCDSTVTVFEKSRRKRLTARRGRDKFPLLRRGEILAARSEKKLRGSKKKLLTSWTERGKFPLRR